MLHFSKTKVWIIAIVCALGVLLSLPNFIKPGTLPDWVPHRHINLGLDLQGGSYLLLEVDMDTVVPSGWKAPSTRRGRRCAPPTSAIPT